MQPRDTSKTRIIFDIDGVLADTKPLVQEAYRLVGVEMPESAWGRPWSEWLIKRLGQTQAARAHAQKNERYLNLLKERPPARLPGATVAKAFIADGYPVGYLTSASGRAAKGVLEGVGLSAEHLIGTGCSTADKIWCLDEEPNRGVYIDDMEIGAMIAMRAEWAFVRARHTDARRLMEDIRRWTQ